MNVLSKSKSTKHSQVFWPTESQNNKLGVGTTPYQSQSLKIRPRLTFKWLPNYSSMLFDWELAYHSTNSLKVGRGAIDPLDFIIIFNKAQLYSQLVQSHSDLDLLFHSHFLDLDNFHVSFPGSSVFITNSTLPHPLSLSPLPGIQFSFSLHKLLFGILHPFWCSINKKLSQKGGLLVFVTLNSVPLVKHSLTMKIPHLH